MTRTEIYFNYLHTRRSANKLRLVSKKLRRIAGDEIEESIKNVERNWTGESGGCFVGKCREFSEKISNEADSLERSAETIENIALRTYNTEMKALDMARKRSYR
mgnify:FL=1